MKRLVLLIFVGMFGLAGFATAQFCELIYDGGVRKSMCSLLLELDSIAFEKIKDRLPQGITITALWRNYIGCWKIKNDSLFLDSVLVSGDSGNYKPILIDDIFAKNKTSSGYFANWVNDSLRVVSGEMIQYVHMGWNSKWENEEFITVENGIVKKRRSYNNRLVNKGKIDDWNPKVLPYGLEFGEIPRRISLEVSYSDFDTEGNPTGCRIIVHRGSGDTATDNRVVTEIENFLLANKSLPIYYIYGKYTAYPYILPIGPTHKD